MLREREAPLCHGGCRGVFEGALGAKDRDISRDRGVRGHRRSEVFAAGRRDEDIIGVNGDILVERGEEKGVENLLSDAGRGRRHLSMMEVQQGNLFYNVRRPGFRRGMFG